MKEEKSKHMLNVDHYYYFYMVNIIYILFLYFIFLYFILNIFLFRSS